MLFLLALVAAQDLPLPATPAIGYSGTLLLPDARHRDDGELEVMGGSGLLVLQEEQYCLSAAEGCGGTIYTPTVVPDVRIAWTPHEDLRLETNLGWSGSGGGLLGTAAVSWSGPISPNVRMGGFLGFAGSTFSDFSGASGTVSGGLNLSAQWPRVAFDMSVPLFATHNPGEEIPIYLPWAMSEAGVSFRLGKGHTFRVGTVSFAPGVGWQYDSGRFLVRADVHSLGMINLMRVEAGARF